MTSFDQALELIKSFARPTGSERIDLFHSLNQTLAENVYSDSCMPPFNKSAMDGYACRRLDISNPLQVIEEIPAGTVPTLTIGENQCARIMTGAMVPEGADWVIMKEDVQEITPELVVCRKELLKSNICYKGEDIKKGDLVLEEGGRILPSHIAILASVGHVKPLVYLAPKVAILSTGSELVEPEQLPAISKIRNSNSYQLMAQAQQLGIVPDYLGIAADVEESLKEILSMSLEKYDVTVISGGVSVGDFDFVPRILKALGVNIRLHGMDVRPGQHMLFGEKDGHVVFGFPGKPGSFLFACLFAQMGHFDGFDFNDQVLVGNVVSPSVPTLNAFVVPNRQNADFSGSLARNRPLVAAARWQAVGDQVP